MVALFVFFNKRIDTLAHTQICKPTQLFIYVLLFFIIFVCVFKCFFFCLEWYAFFRQITYFIGWSYHNAIIFKYIFKTKISSFYYIFNFIHKFQLLFYLIWLQYLMV